jgi:thiamine biosynthesis lipoprotein
MGTPLRVAVCAASRPLGIAAIEAAFAAVRSTDDLLSTWRDDSELARVNRAPRGQPVPLSPQLGAMLAEVGRWSRRTDRAFDPAIGALVDAWDLRGRGRVPSAAELRAARDRTGLAHFRLAGDHRTVVRDTEGAWLDSGGFGKGAALAAARDSLTAHGIASALLNFGGQVLVLGRNPEGAKWVVPVAHPSRRGVPVARLRLQDRSASTSAQSEHFVVVGGRRLGHIVDPRTGHPVPAWGSVTVVAADPMLADILSTALLVLGPDRAIAWAGDHPELGVLVLDQRGGRVRPRWNAGLEPYLVQDSTLIRGG